MNLPMEILVQAKEMEEKQNKYKNEPHSKGKHTKKPVRILIVEDEDTSRETLVCILRDRGYETETAKDGYEAIERTKESSFDIVLIDIILNRLNGVETFKVIRKIAPHTVGIMMTAYSVDDLVQDALKNGARSCIYKPFNIEEVLNLN